MVAGSMCFVWADRVFGWSVGSGMTLVCSGMSLVDSEMNCMNLRRNFVLRNAQVMKNLDM